MIRFNSLLVGSVWALCALGALAQTLSEDGAAVLADVKAANPDMKALCQSGEPAMRKAVSDSIMKLMQERKLKGANPMATGQEVAGALRGECAKVR